MSGDSDAPADTEDERPPVWAPDFFRGPFMPVQRAQGADPDEVAYIARALELDRGPARVLDVPCGTGRHAIVLGSHGHTVHGIDFNEEAIRTGRDEVASRGLADRVTLATGDMWALPTVVGRYDAALCFWGSIGYGTDADDRAFFGAVRRALGPGGRFLVDGHVAETLFPVFEPRGWHWWGEGADRTRVVEERRWDPVAGRMETRWVFQRGDGGETEGSSSIRIYTARELVRLLREAGFADVVLEESLTGEPFDVGADRLAVIARAPD